jgi:multidrug efflux pump subunit AcrB
MKSWESWPEKNNGIPMALIFTKGAEFHRPPAVVYIGGFLFAGRFRPLIVPVLSEVLTGRDQRIQPA